MILRDEHSTLQLSLSTHDTGDDDVYLIAEASTKGFVGRNTSVGVSRRSWDAFIADLQTLEATRTGEARLISMSPADFELQVRSYNGARHIRVAGFVGDYVISRDVTDVARVPFRIEIDPSTLAALVTAFEQLVVRPIATRPREASAGSSPAPGSIDADADDASP